MMGGDDLFRKRFQPERAFPSQVVVDLYITGVNGENLEAHGRPNHPAFGNIRAHLIKS